MQIKYQSNGLIERGEYEATLNNRELELTNRLIQRKIEQFRE